MPQQNGPVTAAAVPMDAARSSRISERRVIRVRVAGFVRRGTAGLIDLLIVLALTTAVTAGAAVVLSVRLPGLREIGPDLLVAGILDRNPMAVGAAGLFLGIAALYQIYFGGILGQTLGKRLMRIRIISVRGAAPGATRGMVRAVALMLSLVPAGLGWLWAIFDREHRSVHDHLSGTYVIIDS